MVFGFWNYSISPSLPLSLYSSPQHPNTPLLINIFEAEGTLCERLGFFIAKQYLNVIRQAVIG